MAPSLTKEVLREELSRFFQESLKPEFVTFAGDLQQVLRHQIIELERATEALMATANRGAKSPKQNKVDPTSSATLSDREADPKPTISSSSLSLNTVSKMGSRYTLSRSTSKLASLSSRPNISYGDSGNSADADDDSVAKPTRMASASHSWMTRHRRIYSSVIEQPRLPRVVEAALQQASDSQSSTNHAASWLGGLGARLWRRRHDESYQKLHLLRDRVVNAAAPQPDSHFDSVSQGSIEGPDEIGLRKHNRISQRRMTRTNLTRHLTAEIEGDYHSIAEPNSNMISMRSSNTRDAVQDESKPLIVRVSTMISTHEFACVVSLLVLSNAAILGLETDYMARNWTHEVPTGFCLAEKVFCVCFFIEILLRLLVYRIDFFTMSGWQANVIDFVVLCIQFVDVFGIYDCITGARPQHAEGAIRLEVPVWRTILLVRLTRLLRLVRVANLLHVLSELRTLIISISDSLKSVFWVLVLLILIMYCMGVYFTQVVTSHKLEHAQRNGEYKSSPSQSSQLENHYGNLLRTMLTLFEAIASGVSWGEVAEPLLQHCSVWMLMCFLVYIFFTMFVVLNIVTGVFVTSATEKAAEDRKKVLLFQLREIFRQVDDDSSGIMNWTKFQHHLQDDKVQMYLKAIDLHQEETLDLFHLLDTDDSGEIDEDEFINGCLRLHGNAKAIDLSAFMIDYKNWTRSWSEHAERMESYLYDLTSLR